MKDSPVWPLAESEALLPNQVDAVASAILGPGPKLATTNTLSGRIALLYVVRTARSLRAIAQLCRMGFAQESAGLVRAILEDAVSLAYLADEPELRAESWARYAENSTDDDSSQRNPWWSGLSPRKMAKRLQGQHRQIGDEFNTVYARLCDDTHGSPTSATHYVVAPKADGELPAILAGPSSHRIAEVCALGPLIATRLCAVAEELGVQLNLDSVLECTMVAMRPYNSGKAPCES